MKTFIYGCAGNCADKEEDCTTTMIGPLNKYGEYWIACYGRSPSCEELTQSKAGAMLDMDYTRTSILAMRLFFESDE